jgi:hypothetical protein
MELKTLKNLNSVWNCKIWAKSAASLCHQVSISPTFYEQLLRQNPFAKKLQTQILST